jgi:hypothetical protein
MILGRRAAEGEPDAKLVRRAGRRGAFYGEVRGQIYPATDAK